MTDKEIKSIATALHRQWFSQRTTNLIFAISIVFFLASTLVPMYGICHFLYNPSIKNDLWGIVDVLAFYPLIDIANSAVDLTKYRQDYAIETLRLITEAVEDYHKSQVN